MATKTQTPTTPLSRLSRLGLSLGFRSSIASPSTSQPRPQRSTDEDYIPYNGPYEQPQSPTRSPVDDRRVDTDGWGPIVNSWITEEPSTIPERRHPTDDHRGHNITARAMTTGAISRPEVSRDSILPRPRSRFLKSDQTGGVGEMPVPVRVRPRRSQESGLRAEGSGNRSSFASIFQFAQPRRVSLMRKVTSSDQLRSREEESQISFPRGHPYAYATPAVSQQGGLGEGYTSQRARSHSSVNLSIKASVSTPNLRLRVPPPSPPSLGTAQTHPQNQNHPATTTALVSGPRTAPSTPVHSVPKPKQRWLSAETWCDALIAPRPRFALKLVDGEGKTGSSGRIVSPPGSPVWPSTSAPAYGAFVTDVTDDGGGMNAQGGEARGALKKSRSAGGLLYNASETIGAGPSTVKGETKEEGERVTEGVVAGAKPKEAAPSTKPHRPKSFAWDDLALLSPVPSLAK